MKIKLYILLIILCAASCSRIRSTAGRRDTLIFLFDTKVTIIAVGENSMQDSAFKIITTELMVYDSLFGPENKFLQSSFLDSISIEVWTEAEKYYRLTGHAYDPTLKPALDLWGDFSSGNITPPDSHTLDFLIQQRSQEFPYIHHDQLILTPGREPDLGGIAKGMAVQSSLDKISSLGLTGVLIEAGGDIYACGSKENNESWKIGIQHPRDINQLIAILSIRDKSVCTSGDYHRYSVIDGIRYHHILDPQTLEPSRGIISATVISDHAGQADALATAFMIMEPDQSNELANDLQIGYLLVIEKDHTMVFQCNAKFLEYCDTILVDCRLAD
ncbi:MAG: FAD:protein FMN transferase [bacterium]